MKIYAPSTSVHVGDSVALPMYCSEPGSVVCTSSNPLVAQVVSPVVIAGTRTWRNGLKHGQYLARANCLQSRDNCAFFIKLRGQDLIADGVTAYTYTQYPIAMSRDFSVANRSNWKLLLHLYRAGTAYFHPSVRYVQSFRNDATEVLYTGYNPLLYSLPDEIRLIITLSGTVVSWYGTTGTAADSTASRTAPSGTMGGTEIMAILFPCSLAKMEGALPSQAQREAFCQNGTLPAGLAASYQGGHEIVESAPVFWDSAGTLDLSAVNAQLWPLAAASGSFTDSPGVVPYSSISVIPLAAGTTTITATRQRFGVPARASLAEREESTTYVLTVLPALMSEQSTAQLMIYASIAGTATIAMDNPIIGFPASVPVVEGKNQVSGLVTGSGTCNVTVTLDGVSDVTTFDVEEILTRIKTGPRQIYGVYL